MSESYFILSNGELKRKDNVIRITPADGRVKDIKIESIWRNFIEYKSSKLFGTK